MRGMIRDPKGSRWGGDRGRAGDGRRRESVRDGASSLILISDSCSGSSSGILIRDPHPGSSSGIHIWGPHPGSSSGILIRGPYPGSTSGILIQGPHSRSLFGSRRCLPGCSALRHGAALSRPRCPSAHQQCARSRRHQPARAEHGACSRGDAGEADEGSVRGEVVVEVRGDLGMGWDAIGWDGMG